MKIGLVELRGGLVVLSAAIALAVDLEQRGHVLSVVGGGDLRLGHAPLLAKADVAAIRRLKRHLVALAAYRPPNLSVEATGGKCCALPTAQCGGTL